MPTKILRPNGNNNELWTVYHYNDAGYSTLIDNVDVKACADGDGLPIYATEGIMESDDGERQQYDMETEAVQGEVTKITLGIRGYGDYDHPLSSLPWVELNIAPGGVWQEGSWRQLTYNYACYTESWNGSWNQSQLNDLLIGLKASLGEKDDYIYIDYAYVEIEYADTGKFFPFIQ